ncbi:ABC transporter permease [Ahniella affigens]|nr:ABC transporter permease [Ahniella affigens]
MFGFLLSSALNSIRRTPILSLLAAATVAVGIGVSIPMMTVFHHMNANPVPDRGDRLFRVSLDNWNAERPFREPNDPPSVLTLQDVKNLASATQPVARAGMFAAEAVIKPEGQGARPFKLAARVTESGFFEMFDPPFLAGSGWDARADANQESVVVIGAGLSQKLFGTTDSVGRQVTVSGRPLTVVGVLAPWELTPVFYDMQNPFAEVEEIFVPMSLMFQLNLVPTFWRSPLVLPSALSYANFEQLFTTTEIVFAQYWVELPDRASADAYRTWLDEYVVAQKALGRFPRPINNRLDDVGAWLDYTMKDSRDAGGVAALIVVTLLFYAVCLFNTVNLLLTKFVRGQSRVSLMRALGAAQSDIFVQYLIEVCLIAIVGGLAGVAIGLVGLDISRSMFEHSSALAVGSVNSGDGSGFWQMDLPMAVTAVLLALVGGAAAGIYPALKACRVSPAIGLKTQ